MIPDSKALNFEKELSQISVWIKKNIIIYIICIYNSHGNALYVYYNHEPIRSIRVLSRMLPRRPHVPSLIFLVESWTEGGATNFTVSLHDTPTPPILPDTHMCTRSSSISVSSTWTRVSGPREKGQRNEEVHHSQVSGRLLRRADEGDEEWGGGCFFLYDCPHLLCVTSFH